MKKIFFLFFAMGLSILAYSQAKEGAVSLNKVDRSAVVGEFAYAPDIVNVVINDDLKSRNVGKSRSFKGFTKHEGILLPVISTEKIDLYYKVERKSKKESDKSIVYLLISKGYDNFISPTSDPAIFEASKIYLNSLLEKFGKEKLSLAIKDQTLVVEKAEKKMNSLYVEGENLKTKIKELQDNLAKNQQAQVDQKGVVEKEKQALESLKTQLK